MNAWKVSNQQWSHRSYQISWLIRAHLNESRGNDTFFARWANWRSPTRSALQTSVYRMESIAVQFATSSYGPTYNILRLLSFWLEPFHIHIKPQSSAFYAFSQLNLEEHHDLCHLLQVLPENCLESIRRTFRMFNYICVQLYRPIVTNCIWLWDEMDPRQSYSAIFRRRFSLPEQIKTNFILTSYCSIYIASLLTAISW